MSRRKMADLFNDRIRKEGVDLSGDNECYFKED